MKNLKRQDKNGVRHASDIERKYKLGQIDYTKEEIERLKMELTVDSSLSASSSNAVANSVITNALNNKVNKEANKGLSTNDFTDELKSKLEGISYTGNYTEYSYYIVTTESVAVIPIEYEGYSEGSVVDVYVNGFKRIRNLHYSIDRNYIVFASEINDIGTEIEIIIK